MATFWPSADIFGSEWQHPSQKTSCQIHLSDKQNGTQGPTIPQFGTAPKSAHCLKPLSCRDPEKLPHHSCRLLLWPRRLLLWQQGGRSACRVLNFAHLSQHNISPWMTGSGQRLTTSEAGDFALSTSSPKFCRKQARKKLCDTWIGYDLFLRTTWEGGKLIGLLCRAHPPPHKQFSVSTVNKEHRKKGSEQVLFF